MPSRLNAFISQASAMQFPGSGRRPAAAEPTEPGAEQAVIVLDEPAENDQQMNQQLQLNQQLNQLPHPGEPEAPEAAHQIGNTSQLDNVTMLVLFTRADLRQSLHKYNDRG